mgnify:CR=1 FL=1
MQTDTQKYNETVTPNSRELEILKKYFPQCFSKPETDKNGAVIKEHFDTEKLAELLNKDEVDIKKEGFTLNFLGKSYARYQANLDSETVIVPDERNAETNSENVYIVGDNLDALQHLKYSYAEKIKCIYIDPPYNTGSDSFIYPDKFSESREEYARRVGDTDDVGYLKRDGVFQGAWRKNGKDSGHYHSNWLSMMLPRLHLAKTLLREDGVIFISIDDNEQAQLKLLCDEVFGAENFVSNIIWEKRYTRSNNARMFTTLTEQIVCYRKSDNLQELKEPRNEKADSTYTNPDNDPRGVWTSVSCVNPATKEQRPNLSYEIQNPHTGEVITHPTNAWKFEHSKYLSYQEDNRLYWGKNGENKYPRLKKFLTEMDGGMVPVDLWKHDETGTTDAASKELESMIGKGIFTFPKPPSLIKRMLKIASNKKDSIILDFFTGSGTTAHAVMQLNAEDGGSRRFICVQLPEETDEKSEARKAGFNTIAEIAKERIRRAGRQISDGLQDGSEIDTGFKVFKLAESGFKQWRQPADTDAESLQGELLLNIDSVQPDTPSENLLYELMLRMGLKLTCKVSFSDDVYFVEDEDTGGLYAFLLERVDQGLIDAVLAKHPVKVAALDRLFEGDDALKSNTVLQMKDAGVMFECV